MNKYILNLKRYKPLLQELVRRDIKVRYRKSVLGVFWTLLSPLLMMIVLSFVFSNMFKFAVANYPVYILSGQVVFNFFSESTNASMTSIINNAQLIKKVYIPKYILTISSVVSSIINVMASFTALILVMVAMRSELHYTMIISFIPLLVLFVFATGIGLILASYSVKFRDITHFYSVFLTALMYLMPVIYPMSIVENVPIVNNIVAWNPLTIILNTFRDLVMNGVIENIFPFFVVSIISFLVLILGFFVFYKKQDTFIMDL